MPLMDIEVFGTVDKVQVAMDRLKTFEPPEGFWVADSGGKDSEVIYHLVHMAHVKADYHHNLTTIDAPQTIRHIRDWHHDTVIERPEMPLLKMMLKKGIPPLRTRRWCCSEYKEKGGVGRFVVTGIRSEESTKRAARKMVESCYRGKSKRYLNPIFDWTEADVWEYIRAFGLQYNRLYDPPFNYKRIGCVLCPMVRDIDKQRSHFPRIYEAWHKALVRLYNDRVSKGKHVNHTSGERFWEWWLNRDARAMNPDQTTLFE